MANTEEKNEWFESGFNGIPESTSSEWSPPRYFMKKGEEKKIIFVDEEPFRVWEHQLLIGDSWSNWRTCTQSVIGSCPLCDAGLKKYYVGFLTIVDRSEFVDRNGKLRKDTKKLLAAKTDSLNYLKRKKEKCGGLIGKEFTVFRAGERSASIGSEYEFNQVTADLSKFTERDREGKERPLVPYKYQDLFKPKTAAELTSLVKTVNVSKMKEQNSSFTAASPTTVAPATKPEKKDGDSVPY